jgi:hypothetical protein
MVFNEFPEAKVIFFNCVYVCNHSSFVRFQGWSNLAKQKVMHSQIHIQFRESFRMCFPQNVSLPTSGLLF